MWDVSRDPPIMLKILPTVNQVIFVHENIHKLNFHLNKFSRVLGIRENILT